MYKKFKALWYAAVSVVVVSIGIVFMSVIVPILLALTAIGIVGLVAYVVYKVSQEDQPRT